MIVLAVLFVLGLVAAVALGAFANKVADSIDESAKTEASVVEAGGVAGDADEVIDVVPEATCRKLEFGLFEWPITITNNSSKTSNYFIEAVVEQGETKVGDLSGFVQNVGPGQVAKDKLVGTAEVTGNFACRIVKVDRTSAN